ncbi:unnamed protein product [Cylindrotheca closterium]|uniref:Uncharacterized protein n=1 Tax=Cylindrotheca closterium TaxID=2856 RepID=A0AAD2CLL4_9STRA|nr:unnamed protein product [Cylindrotheca closterium]
MKFTAAASLSLTIATIATVATAEESATDATRDYSGVTGEVINERVDNDFTEDIVYDGTCAGQSACLGFTVHEVQRRCGSGSCEFTVCYQTEVGYVAADKYYEVFSKNVESDRSNMDEATEAALEASKETCKLHPDYGVDYAGNMHTESFSDEGGCQNADNPSGKGYWDETCINPETADASSGIVTSTTGSRFSRFCQVAYPGQTVHFMMHSYNRLDWNGENPTPVTCSGSAEIGALDGDDAKWGKSQCAPSTSNSTAPKGQTFFPATDGSTGGTCSEEPEGNECVWSYTAPTDCAYEENYPTCYITQESVDTVDTLCGASAGPVVEYFEHANNPNGPPPRVPLHDIVMNGDGTVSFKIYNPYGNYAEPINYTSTEHLYKGDDFHNMYVVYDQANEIGNEVCDLQPGSGKCATDEEYTAKCRSDGVAIVTVFASGFDETSGAAQDITNGSGTDVFECCPATYQPLDHYNTAQTAAWTFLVHCECPEDEEADPDRLRRRNLSESVSNKFQNGKLFTENQKKLHNLL